MVADLDVLHAAVQGLTRLLSVSYLEMEKLQDFKQTLNNLYVFNTYHFASRKGHEDSRSNIPMNLKCGCSRYWRTLLDMFKLYHCLHFRRQNPFWGLKSFRITGQWAYPRDIYSTSEDLRLDGALAGSHWALVFIPHFACCQETFIFHVLSTILLVHLS